MPAYIATAYPGSSVTNKNIQIYDYYTRRLLGMVGPGVPVAPNVMVFSPSGRFLLITYGGYPPFWHVFDRDAGWGSVAIPTGVNSMQGACFTADEHYCVATSTVSAVGATLYDTTDWSVVTKLVDSGSVYGATLSPDGAALVVYGGASPYLWVFDTSDWSAISVASPGVPCYGAAFSPDGSEVLLSLNTSPYLKLIDTSDWTYKAAISAAAARSGRGCVYTPDGAVAVNLTSASPYIDRYDTSDWSMMPALSDTYPAPTSSGGNQITITPDNKYLMYPGSVSGSAGTGYVAIRLADWKSVGPGAFPYSPLELKLTACVKGSPLEVRGEVRDIDGYVAARRVRAYVRETGQLCAETVSSGGDGSYSLELYEGDAEYDIQFMADPLENLNDLFYARTTGGTVP